MFIEDFLKTSMTICANCHHFIDEWRVGMAGSPWHMQYCGAKEAEKKPAIDPVTGRKGYVSKNDLGGSFISDERRPHARDINTCGNCPYYKQKEEKKSAK